MIFILWNNHEIDLQIFFLFIKLSNFYYTNVFINVLVKYSSLIFIKHYCELFMIYNLYLICLTVFCNWVDSENSKENVNVYFTNCDLICWNDKMKRTKDLK